MCGRESRDGSHRGAYLGVRRCVCGGSFHDKKPNQGQTGFGCKKTKEAQAEVRRKGKSQQSVGKGPLCNKHCLSHQRVKGHHLQSSRGGKGKLSCLWLCAFATGLLPQKQLQPHFPSSGGAGEVREAQPRFTPPAPLLRTERQPGDKAPHIWDGPHSNRETSEVRRHRWCYKGYTGVTSTSLGAKLPPPLSTLGCSSVKWG